MKRTHLLFCIVCCLLSTVFLWGCGGGGGGGAVYNTVTVTASSDTTLLDSDVAKHSDVTNCGVSGTDTITISPDDVDVTINSSTIPNLPEFVTASRVRLDKVTVIFSPANPTSPALPQQNYTLGTYVEPGGSATVPVRVASQELKSGNTLSALVCTNTTYSYYVILKFEGVEIDTDQRETFETTLNVKFSDFVD